MILKMEVKTTNIKKICLNISNWEEFNQEIDELNKNKDLSNFIE